MSDLILRYIILPNLIIVVGIGVFFLARWIYFAWTHEKALSGSLFLYDLARNLLADPEARESLPQTTATAIETLPLMRKALLEDVARKSHRPVDELEKALLADTGTFSIEDALQAPMGNSTVEDTLLRFVLATRDPFRLAARWWIQKSRRGGAGLLSPAEFVAPLEAERQPVRRRTVMTKSRAGRTQFQQRFVAFVDILGFRSIVDRMDKEPKLFITESGRKN